MDNIIYEKEYFAPNLEESRATASDILCVSFNIDVEGNPFEGNTEEQW